MSNVVDRIIEIDDITEVGKHLDDFAQMDEFTRLSAANKLKEHFGGDFNKNVFKSAVKKAKSGDRPWMSDKESFIPVRAAREFANRHDITVRTDVGTPEDDIMRYHPDGVWYLWHRIGDKVIDMLGDDWTPRKESSIEKALSRIEDQRKIDEWNVNDLMVNCRNGMVDPVSKEIREHRMSDFSTFQVPLDYNPEVDTTLARNYMLDLMEGDEERVRVLEEMLGYLLVPRLDLQKIFILTGEGNTGKTTFIKNVRQIFHRNDWHQVSTHSIQNDKFAGAELIDKLFAYYDDESEEDLESANIIKAYTGGDDFQRVRDMYTKGRSMVHTARLFMSCNGIPKLENAGYAWYRRLAIIPFNNSYKGGDRELEYLDRVKQETDAFLKLAIDGLGRLINNGWVLTESSEMQLALDRYNVRNDNRRAFVDSQCTIGDGGHTKRKKLYTRYTAFCGRHIKPVSSIKFYEYVRGLDGVEDVTIHGYDYFKNITCGPIGYTQEELQEEKYVENLD